MFYTHCPLLLLETFGHFVFVTWGGVLCCPLAPHFIEFSAFSQFSGMPLVPSWVRFCYAMDPCVLSFTEKLQGNWCSDVDLFFYKLASGLRGAINEPAQNEPETTYLQTTYRLWSTFSLRHRIPLSSFSFAYPFHTGFFSGSGPNAPLETTFLTAKTAKAVGETPAVTEELWIWAITITWLLIVSNICIIQVLYITV